MLMAPRQLYLQESFASLILHGEQEGKLEWSPLRIGTETEFLQR